MKALVSRAFPMACVAVLVVNDHVLKAWMPGLVTGKLSDFAGLFFFPLLAADVLAWLGRTDAQRVLFRACIATALGFIAVKTWHPAHELYCVGLGALQWPVRAALAHGGALPGLRRVSLTMDPTDLVALVAVVAAYRYAYRQVAAGDLDHATCSLRPGT